MDRLARKVAARWGLRVATSAATASVPLWAVAWGEWWANKLAARVAYSDQGEGYELTETTDEELFAEARESVHIMLPKFQALLRSKLHDSFHASVSRSRNREYYFFEAPSGLETFSVNLLVNRGHIDLVVGYVPYGLTTEQPDFSKAIDEHQRVLDPEMAGLALMRAAHNLFNLI